MVNIETYFVNSGPPTVLPALKIPLLGPTVRPMDDGSYRADGLITTTWFWDSALQTELRTFIYTIWGGYTTKNASAFVSGITEENYYSPFSCSIARPQPPNDYEDVNKIWVRNLRVAMNALALQSSTKTAATYTITTSDKLVYANTASNTITFTLPALAGVTADVIYSTEKTSASNNMVLDPNGAETIGGASTRTVTALHGRVDFAKDTSTNWKVVNA